jgi:hypothetical protein
MDIGDVFRVIGYYDLASTDKTRNLTAKFLRGKQLITIPDTRKLGELESTDLVLTEYYRIRPRKQKDVDVVVVSDRFKERETAEDKTAKEKVKGKKAKDKGKAKGKKGKSKKGKKK